MHKDATLGLLMFAVMLCSAVAGFQLGRITGQNDVLLEYAQPTVGATCEKTQADLDKCIEVLGELLAETLERPGIPLGWRPL